MTTGDTVTFKACTIKVDTPSALLQSLVAERPEELRELLQVFTGTSTVSQYIPQLGVECAGRINRVSSSTTAELAVRIRMAVNQ